MFPSELRVSMSDIDPSNNRIQERHSVSARVTMGSEHNFYTGFTQDISSGGLFLATNELGEIGDIITFGLQLGEGQTEIELQGEVRWVRESNEWTSDVPPGMGVKFLGLDPRIGEKIEEFIASTREAIFFDDDDDF
jgi:uncharacterized protein (TIGR02266 family)